MPQPVKNIRPSATAFSWNQEGHCRAVRLSIERERLLLLSHWRADVAPKSSAIAEAFAAGRKELGCEENDFILLAPPTSGWGAADLTLPPLSQEETRAALEFELRKQTPIPPDRLVWGFRTLPSTSTEERRLRLFYVRSDAWRHWLKCAEGLAHLDIIAPAPITLDPLLAEQAVAFPEKNAFSYLPTATGREIAPLDAQTQFPPLPPIENLDPGSLASLTEAEQREYTSAIILAAYGLTRETSSDAKTLPRVPDAMLPKRHLFAQYASAFLLVVTIAFLCIGLLRGIQNRRAQIQLLENEIRKVDATNAALRKQFPPNAIQAAKTLETELLKYQDNTPELNAVLCELTRIIQPPSWLGGGFEWKATSGLDIVPITFTIKEPIGTTENQELALKLNNSPILGDAKEIQSMVGRNNLQERRFSLNARLDIGNERQIALEYAKSQVKEEKEEPPAEEEEMEEEELMEEEEEE